MPSITVVDSAADDDDSVDDDDDKDGPGALGAILGGVALFLGCACLFTIGWLVLVVMELKKQIGTNPTDKV